MALTDIPGWRMGLLVLGASLALVAGGLYRLVALGDVSPLRLGSLVVAVGGVLIGIRLVTPSRHDTQ